MATYDVNYNDKRFQQVANEKATELRKTNSTYNEMIDSTEKHYQELIDASKDYAEQQKQNQQEQTDHLIDKTEQQKDQAKQDYTKEQKAAYADYQKASNQYGANAEALASKGMSNTGYSESSQVSMYNTYQNRYMTARESYNRAILNYDNAIKDAQLANNSALAEIAYQALQTQLQLSLEGFQYKNNLLLQQLQAQRDIDNSYYQRWQNVLQQINTENSLKEQVRQYNESLAFQREEATREQSNWERQFALSQQVASINKSSGGSSGGSSSKKSAEESTKQRINQVSNRKSSKSSSSNNASAPSTITLSNGKKAYQDAQKAYIASGGSSPYSSQGVIKNGLVKSYSYKGTTYYYVP